MLVDLPCHINVDTVNYVNPSVIQYVSGSDSLICFCPLAYTHWKPKKKKAESIPTEGSGTEAKSKKSKNRKNGDLSTESSPANQKSETEANMR